MTKTNRNLKPGTLVVSKADGERGTIERICTFRRNGQDAWSYREVWEAGELFLPSQTAAE